MTLNDDHAVRLARAEHAATALGAVLPDWSARPPGSTSWAPRLVHTGGAQVMVSVEGGRLILRSCCPDRARASQWETLKITVAVDTPAQRVAADFTRRLSARAIAQHAAVTRVIRADVAHEEAMGQACRTLRAQVPLAMLDRPWPSDLHDVRIRSAGRQVFTVRLRVTGADCVDVEAHALPVALAGAVARALSQDDSAQPVGGGWASTGPVAEVSTALLPQAEMDTIAGAPTPVAVFDRGAWVHSVGATTTDTDAGEAWQGWPSLRAVLLRAAQAGIGWVLFDPDASPVAPADLPRHDW